MMIDDSLDPNQRIIQRRVFRTYGKLVKSMRVTFSPIDSRMVVQDVQRGSPKERWQNGQSPKGNDT